VFPKRKAAELKVFEFCCLHEKRVTFDLDPADKRAARVKADELRRQAAKKKARQLPNSSSLQSVRWHGHVRKVGQTEEDHARF
jgi:hypothetical protein